MTTADRIAQDRRIVANRLYADAYKPRLAAYWIEQKCAADYALDATA